MLNTQRKPVSVGEMLVEEFLNPLGLTQGRLAEAMGVQRKLVNSPDFWLNTQRRVDLWEALHTPARRRRIERARELGEVA